MGVIMAPVNEPVKTDTPPPGSPLPATVPDTPRADIQFAAKDAGLRQDVHDLGVLVGKVLAEQGGQGLYDRVEAARQAAIARREGDPEAGRRLEAVVAALPPDQVRDFIRSFSTYFQAVNTAEQVHRIRRRRAYLREGVHRQPHGIEDVICRLKDQGVTLAEMAALVRQLRFEPVLTPHPTEPTRRTILRRQQDIVRRLLDLQNPALSPGEVAADMENIRDDLTAIWQTEEHPGEVRTVADELEHVLFFLTEVIYRVTPVLYENLGAALVTAYGEEARRVELPVLFRVASLLGGDMVGRNEITARSIRDSLTRQRNLILALYRRECADLAEKLSQSTSRVAVAPELEERIRLLSGHFPNVAGLVPARHREMPYRVFLRLVMARLQAGAGASPYPYESADEFAADIRLIADSLAAHQGLHGGLFAVRRLLRRIDTFGFHFMTLNLRQEALVNRRVIGRCLNEPGWLGMDGAARTARLRQALATHESPLRELDNESRRVIGVFQGISWCRRHFGERAIGPYLISMAEGVDDVLSVLLLAEWGELRRRQGADGTGVPLDIAPAFETMAALEAAPGLMTALWDEPLYREHLEARGRRQMVLVGVADTDQDTDLASGRWGILKAHRALMATADRAQVDLTVSHGRGGAVSPGGGKAHADVLSAAPGTVRGRVRAIEPGEQVANKYGVRAIALRTMEQAVAAAAETTARPATPPPDRRETWERAAELVARASREHYQALVQSPGFTDYYRLATPADVIERMRHGADTDDSVPEGLLAAAGTAPWVYAWTQTRNILPGWYGIGHGLGLALAEFGTGVVQEMTARWFFFRTLVSDVELALAKSDLDMAARYSVLAGELHDRFFPGILAAFQQTVQAVLTARNQQVLLERSDTLRRSIRLRNPYVDPMSLLQVELLRRWRETRDEAVLDTLIASVNGIARGLQDGN